MQNKGAILTFAILLAAVCFYQLSFTWVSNKVKDDAIEYAQGDEMKEFQYLDSMKSEVVYNFLGLKKFTFKDVQELEINLGLDLKGGMNVTLQVEVQDIIRAMSNYSDDETFNAALALATKNQQNSTKDYVTLFGEAFEEIDPNAKLASVFNTLELRDQVNFNTSNADVLKIIDEQTKAAIANAFNIIRTRIDRFGVAQPNIQNLQTSGRILVELPGVKDQNRVRSLLQGTANLEFWETYENQEVYQYMLQANERIKEMQVLESEKSVEDTTPETTEAEATADTTEENSLLSELEAGAAGDTTATPDNLAAFKEQYPLFALLNPSTDQTGQLYAGPIVGIAHAKDTAEINTYLHNPQIKSIFPRDLKFAWTAKSMDEAGNYYRLIALKVTTRDGKAPLDGGVITDARQDFDQFGSNPEVAMQMNAEGAKVWQRMTKENVGKSIAIVLDGYVRSFPNVNQEIAGGRSSISGLESIEEAQDLANVLKSGKMPAPARIIQEDIVGPSLGQKAINSGLLSFVIAFALVLLYMLFFYSKNAGLAANIALIANMFFIFGILASLGAVLTLPGIAGIVLTIGMSVDANVLIYERIQEEMRAGKGVKLAITDGYKNAYSAIIDGQVTTLLTGIVLYMFGSGPIKGFATTLIIGILTSLFSAIFLTRLIFEWQLKKGGRILFASTATEGWLRNMKIKFLEKRKMFYVISGLFILISIGSFFVRGLNYGIDFKGGRSYIVEFQKDVEVGEVRAALADVFGAAPEVKTSGEDIKITTDYRIEDRSEDVDNEVEALLMQGLKDADLIDQSVTLEEFTQDYQQSSQKVGPTISDDIRKDAAIAIGFSLIIIFLYILVRFRDWQYGLGAVAALAHDSLIVLGIFSLLSGVLPFSLEIDQAFIAAILTVLGYSINDTVVVFDRIREYLGLHPKRDREENVDAALNSTLRRTFSTSLSTFVVLLAIFLFGGATIRGFTFALLIGVVVGTYSSLFIATPIAHDTRNRVAKAVAKRKK
ncbi:SecD/SecF fusion protein [Draconibacterium orientale]|uniref:Multifunctional fusion protein n=1 Tax=Draconibacterium orientale TaxID=1168034 RepID=X5DXH7_9BACT|nr:protein translocase subunit SecDF [Draconibacterium orientale]AHW59920.1 preprotein translocase subunit SecD [Draconibacterium orientale]SEU10628.1 SecD/SecF fusion protein [Draconibacterium orientale]